MIGTERDPEFLRLHLQRGLLTRVAEKLGLSKSGRAHVSRVLRGERRSPRVEAALRAEMKRINREIQKALATAPQANQASTTAGRGKRRERQERAA